MPHFRMLSASEPGCKLLRAEICPFLGCGGTSIAPHETGIQIMAASAVTKMVNEMFSF